ncbi:DUF397 domain-containing protein [Streptomyces sp. SID8379]|uniref:DUF397 domain-containing protein n=1 Tax=unclassified Streptomyces TaxID=2593676 RepID=UPI00036D44A6|nr:DUF397 domain-containing protein [Streptomyces sp. HmicA12]MYW65619.1 DUF397 domain-containing protein [Streptomyces sp. SID8379]
MTQAWAWRKSSKSAQTDDCVEVACTGAGIRVRDSKRRGDVIAVAPAAWVSFLRSLPGASFARGTES